MKYLTKIKLKIIIMSIAIALFFILLIAEPDISFKPFKVQFNAIYNCIGWVLIIVGIAFLRYQTKKDTTSDNLEYVNSLLDDTLENLKQDIEDRKTKPYEPNK